MGALTLRSRLRGPDRDQENPCHAHAMETLRKRGIPASRIVRVDPYAVTFCSQQGEVLTAWLIYLEDREQVLVWTQPGLPAFP